MGNLFANNYHVSYATCSDVSLEIIEHRGDSLVRHPIHQLEHQLQLLRFVVPYHVRAFRQDRLLLRGHQNLQTKNVILERDKMRANMHWFSKKHRHGHISTTVFEIGDVLIVLKSV